MIEGPGTPSWWRRQASHSWLRPAGLGARTTTQR
jgi:hypothetical protein